MTTLDDRTRHADTPAGAGREAHRRELATLLDLDPAALPDAALLVDDLCLDSLSMMSVRTWLETRGVTIGTERSRLASIGDVLSLVEKATFPGLSITVTGGRNIGPPGPAAVAAPGPPDAGSPLAPVLGNRAFQLTPIEPDDIGFLYLLAVQPETGFRWRYRGAVPPVDQFAAELSAQVLVQYVVRRTEDGQPVGHVVAYAANPTVRHAHVGAVFQPQFAGMGMAAHAVAMFVRYLFHTFPLHKLYLEIPGFNWPQLRSGEGRLFQVEGVLRDHEYYAGRTWDKYLCAIYRDQLSKDVP